MDKQNKISRTEKIENHVSALSSSNINMQRKKSVSFSQRRNSLNNTPRGSKRKGFKRSTQIKKEIQMLR